MGKIKYYAIGHSYLKHGPFEGWQTEGFWGMAATSPEKDYFHRFIARLEGLGREVEAVAENHAELERLCKPGAKAEDFENSASLHHIRAQMRAFKPNLVSVFLDANCISREREDMEVFYDALYGAINAEKQENAVVLCVVCNRAYTKEAGEKHGLIIVDAQKIHEKRQEREENPYYAFKQYPVYNGKIEFRTHPGDFGHDYIAEELFRAVKDCLPETAAEGSPLQVEAQKKEGKTHKVGRWDFEDFAETGDLEIGGFNLRVEDSKLQLSAAMDTGLSVGCKKMELCCEELLLTAAVEGDAKLLRVEVFGEVEQCFTVALADTALREYRFPLSGKVEGFRIAPDGLDCHIVIDKIYFMEEEQ